MTITTGDIDSAAKTALKRLTGINPDYVKPQKADERIFLDDWQVPGSSVKVRANKPIRSTDVSAQTSQTVKIEKGIKAFTLNVRTVIADTDRELLRELVEKVNAVDENGKRVIYPITNTLANAMLVTKVRFEDNFSVSQNRKTHSWTINFTLEEFDSVSARIESLNDNVSPENAVTQSTPGTGIDSSEGEEILHELKGIERYLQLIDDYLAPDEDS